MGEKSTGAEVDKRVRKVFNMLLSGANHSDILHLASESGWDVGERAIGYYITQARKDMKTFSDELKADEMNLARLRYEDLYKRMYFDKDYKGSLTAQREIDRLMGNSETKIKLTSELPITIVVEDAGTGSKD